MLERAPPPINASVLDHARREVEVVLAAAKRGHEASQRAIIRMAASNVLEASLRRLAQAADAVAPNGEAVKNDLHLSDAQIELRFAADAAQEPLSRAAGRAVVIAIKASEPEDAA